MFIFEAGIPQNNKEIFACYIEDDGLETIKNQGRHDVKGRWQGIEDMWVDIVKKQTGSDTIQWIKPEKCLSYQNADIPFEIFEEDFKKTIIDYMMYNKGIDLKSFSDDLASKIIYSSNIDKKADNTIITIKGGE